MTTVFSASFKQQDASRAETVGIWFILRYPAGMVLYWTLSNALQIVQPRVIKV